ncbi:MAG: ferredoxin, partial [Litorivicinaceae bacterium]
MSQWIQVSAINTIADGAYERFELDEVDVLIFREG